MHAPRRVPHRRAYLAVFVACMCGAALGACDDGVTPDCPAMPIVHPETGEPIGPTAWSDPSLGPGGASNRWREAAAAVGCATLPQAPGGAAGSHR